MRAAVQGTTQLGELSHATRVCYVASGGAHDVHSAKGLWLSKCSFSHCLFHANGLWLEQCHLKNTCLIFSIIIPTDYRVYQVVIAYWYMDKMSKIYWCSS